MLGPSSQYGGDSSRQQSDIADADDSDGSGSLNFNTLNSAAGDVLERLRRITNKLEGRLADSDGTGN